MKVLVIIKANKDSEAGVMPSHELLAAMTEFNEALVKAGVMLSGEGLHPSSKGVRIRCTGKDRAVTNGPFAATSELVAGIWMWKVKSMDDAIAWINRSPFQEGEIEIRPVFEAEDFGEALTPELREKEARLREESARQNAK